MSESAKDDLGIDEPSKHQVGDGVGLPYLEVYCSGVTMETVSGFITQTRYDEFSSDLLQFARDDDGIVIGAYAKVGNWKTTSDAYGLMKSFELITFNGAPMEVSLKFESKKKRQAGNQKKKSLHSKGARKT